MEDGGGGDRATAATMDQWRQFSRLFQFYLDKTTPHAVYRWRGTAALVVLYALRVYYVQGFYIVSYGLGIYILNLLIGFLSPFVDPEVEPYDGPLLPTKGSDEFKPFIRRMPEFKFWYYYSSSYGYYYDPSSGMYCNAASGQWYSYNQETGAYDELPAGEAESS